MSCCYVWEDVSLCGKNKLNDGICKFMRRKVYVWEAVCKGE